MGFFDMHGDVFLHGLLFPCVVVQNSAGPVFPLSKVAGILLFLALELGNSHLDKGTQPETATRVQEVSARPQELPWAGVCSEHPGTLFKEHHSNRESLAVICCAINNGVELPVICVSCSE